MRTILSSAILTLIACSGLSCSTSYIPFEPEKQYSIIAEDAKMELLWEGGKFTEGPTLDAEGAVLFTDIFSNKIMRFDPKTGKTALWRDNSGSANGLKATKRGLLVCEGADGGFRSISLIKNGRRTVIADKLGDKRFNSPNDIDEAPNGDLYFTDPRYVGEEKMELAFEGVYLIRKGRVSIATKELQRPNGIVITRDGKHAIIADNNHFPGGNRTLVKMSIREDGTLHDKKVLFSFRDDQRGFDGLALDMEGNIYATAGLGADAGIYVFSSEGKHLAFIDVPENPTNCTFGGVGEENVLYFTAQVITGNTKPLNMGLYRIKLKKKGHRLYP
jgi:gluconolactonase